MDFNQGLAILAQRGLNIFGAIPLKQLPPDLRTFAPGMELDHFHLCVLGHGGSSLWKSLPHPLDRASHPIDQYTLEQIRWFASTVLHDEDFILAYPRADGLLPLQRLGRFLNLARPSALGLDIHSEYGLWFAYRGVFLTAAAIPKVVGQALVSPCEACVEKPCLNVKADSARLACPFRARHRYSAAQMAYHMRVRPDKVVP